MTTLIDIDAFLSRALGQRSRVGTATTKKRRSVATAFDLAESCGAKVLIKPFLSPAYLRATDTIIIPPQPYRLVQRPKLLATAILHELVHWSGAATRLNRLHSEQQFDTAYNREELIAEIGAVLLSSDLGITTRPILPNYKYLAAYLATVDRPDVALRVALGQADLAASFLQMTGQGR